ncbi:hypothetical protein LR48_Vigan09g152400 [Vigna angularis]|uniref:Uncharacterized protein n=1 Tax=Phaseolus angularis TaxID=3914 RepID=A0A0L9VCS5_PHAAN|nr:hypothetical protein LR48_Vigan09g152400 [Vigna angularis]
MGSAVLTQMGSTAVEKTEEVLRSEIDELFRQQREIFFLMFVDFVDYGEASRSSRSSQRCLGGPVLRTNGGVRQTRVRHESCEEELKTAILILIGISFWFQKR